MQIYKHKALKNTFLLFALVFIDQLSKYIIRRTGGFYICNKGVAFGIKVPETIIVSLIIVLLAYFIMSKPKIQIPKFNFSIRIWDLIWHLNFEIWNLAILLILSGAISNLVDRFYFGCVIDFIDLKFWPIFNLADIYITIGGIIVLYCLFVKQK